MSMNVDFGPKFDWYDVLDRLIAGEKPSEAERVTIQQRAGPWTTCACGQMCKIIPRDSSKSPIDEQLRTLGGAFAQQMSAGHYHDARKTLDKIEKRTAKILTDMGVLFTLGGKPRTFHRVITPVPDTPVKAPVKVVKPRVVTHNIAERFVFRGGH
jgi:hypothetical protein